jgi:hypothetical protein
MNERELSELFRKLGARNPAGWARSQLEEDLPQLARFLFLRQAWKLVVKRDDPSWISEARQIDAKAPGGDVGPALERLLSAGASEDDLTTVARVMQWKLLAGLCGLLDDPGDLETEVKDVAWRLFQVDDNDSPTAPIGGLIESVLETEPSGREMRSG